MKKKTKDETSSFFHGQGAFLSLIAGFLIILLAYLIKSKRVSNSTTITLSFILAGGTGHLIDHIFNEGSVIDFMKMGIGPIRTGIFNMLISPLQLERSGLSLF